MPYHSCQCIRNYLNMMLLPPGMGESVKKQGETVHVQTIPVGENRTQLTVLARAASVPTYLAVGRPLSSCLTCTCVLQLCKVFLSVQGCPIRGKESENCVFVVHPVRISHLPDLHRETPYVSTRTAYMALVGDQVAQAL